MTEQVPIIFVPNALFTNPGTPQGWLDTAAQWVREQGGDPQAVSPESISGKLIIRQGPQWAHSFGLQAAFAGTMDTPEARQVRATFETGTAIDIAAYGGFERFATFAYAFRKIVGPSGGYGVGLPPGDQSGSKVVVRHEEYAASNDLEALLYAQEWCYNMRNTEILEAREYATALRDGVAKANRLVVDLWVRLLQDQGLLLNMANEAVCWMNGAHGMYAVEASSWCYGLEVSAPIAVAYYLLALKSHKERGSRDDRTKPAPVTREQGIRLFAPEGWAATDDGENTYAWKDGHIAVNGYISQQGKKIGWVVFESVMVRGAPGLKISLNIMGKGRKKRGQKTPSPKPRVLASSLVPRVTETETERAETESAELTAPTFNTELATAWAVSLAVARFRKTG